MIQILTELVCLGVVLLGINIFVTAISRQEGDVVGAITMVIGVVSLLVGVIAGFVYAGQIKDQVKGYQADKAAIEHAIETEAPEAVAPVRP